MQMLTSGTGAVKQYLARLYNAIASLCVGESQAKLLSAHKKNLAVIITAGFFVVGVEFTDWITTSVLALASACVMHTSTQSMATS